MLRSQVSILRLLTHTAWIAGLMALAVACAQPALEGDDDVDAATGVTGPDPTRPAKVLYFMMGEDAWVASAAGTEGQRICRASTPHPDERGARALCVPALEALDTQLALFDVAALQVITSYDEWGRDMLIAPTVSPDGSKVAYGALNDALLDVILVYDDANHQIASVEAFDFIGWAGSDALVIKKGQPAIWAIGADEPHYINGNQPRAVGPEPAGAVYETMVLEFKVHFIDVNGETRELGKGQLGGVWGSRVLIIPVDGVGPARLVDLADSEFGAEIELPPVPFDRMLGTRLVGPDQVIIEKQLFVTCGVEQQRYATQSFWHDVERSETTPLADTEGEVHAVLVDASGSVALILDLEPCGAPKGTGRILNLSTDRSRPLSDFLADPVTAGAVSGDGRFVAVAVANGVQVIDLVSDEVRIAGTGSAGGSVLHFR